MEDEEHAINKRCIKDVLNIDDQESISKFLWDIRNIRVNSGSECTLVTDHYPLVHLLSQPNLSRRQARWMGYFARFNYSWLYRHGA